MNNFKNKNELWLLRKVLIQKLAMWRKWQVDSIHESNEISALLRI
jgi:hypothetical protein